MYRGPLLQECAEEWCIAPRERFALQYVGALEALAGYELAEGRATMAARYLALAARRRTILGAAAYTVDAGPGRGGGLRLRDSGVARSAQSAAERSKQ